MHVVINSKIEVHDPTQELQTKAYRVWCFDNPQFIATEKYSRWGASKIIPPVINLARFDSKKRILYLPRGSEELEIVDCIDYLDERVYAPIDEWPTPQGELTPEQQRVFAQIQRMQHQRATGVFLCELTTGLGKTFLALYTISELLKQRTLIACPTLAIIQGWKADIERFYGWKASDIGRIQAGVSNLDAPLILASYASLGQLDEETTAYLQTNVGAVVIDEAHKLGANKLYDLMADLPAAYMIGLTATAQGGRQHNHHIEAILGRPLISIKIAEKDTPTTMYLRGVNIVHTAFVYASKAQYLDYHDLLNNMQSDETRNAQIVKQVLADYKAGMTILVLTRRVEHAQLLVSMISEHCSVVNIMCGATNQHKQYTNALFGAIKQRYARITVATDAAVGLGTNLPALDSLHITLPFANKTNLEQAIGRIRRAEENKKTCIVTYYLDSSLAYCNHLYSRYFKPVMAVLGVKAKYKYFGKSLWEDWQGPKKRWSHKDIANEETWLRNQRIRSDFRDAFK